MILEFQKLFYIWICLVIKLCYLTVENKILNVRLLWVKYRHWRTYIRYVKHSSDKNLQA